MIPFFGPIIPQQGNYASCPAGWGMLIQVFNNVIEFLITLGIVFVAPLSVAYAGFLFVVNPVNSGGIDKAKSVLTNTIVGIVIALAGWMIVDAMMVVLYNGSLGSWSSLITSGGQNFCLPQTGAPYTSGAVVPAGVTVACSVPALTPLTDSAALQMEDGQTVVWTGADPRLRPCATKFITQPGIGGTVTSAYRPQTYQTHLFEIRDRWCTQGLQYNTSTACSALKNSVSAELTRHALSCSRPVATNSNHTAGKAIDVTGFDQSSSDAQAKATASCLTWYGPGDPVHYTLKDSCTCN